MKKQTLLERIASLVLQRLDERYDTIGQKYIAYFDIFPKLQHDGFPGTGFQYELSPSVNIEEEDFDELDIEALESGISMEDLLNEPEVFDQIQDSYTKVFIKNFMDNDWKHANEFSPLGVTPGVKVYYVKEEEDGSVRYRGIIVGMSNSKDAVTAVKRLIEIHLERKPGLGKKYHSRMKLSLDPSQN